MKRLLLLLFSLIGLTAFAQTQTLTPPTYESALMYRVSGKNLKKPSYLFGSYHVIPHEFVTRNERFLNIAQSVDKIVTETDLTQMKVFKDSLEREAKAFVLKTKHLLEIPADSQIVNVAPEKFQYINDFFQRYNIETRIDPERPWWHYNILLDIIGNPTGFSLHILRALAHEKTGFPKDAPTTAIDYHMFALADSLGKEKGELESFEYQRSLAPMFNIDYSKIVVDSALTARLQGTLRQLGTAENQADMLYQFAQTLDKQFVPLFQKIFELYLSQDGIATAKKLDEIPGAKEAFEGIQTQQRNLNWIPVIEKMGAEKPTLFVFGCAHLFDGKGGRGVLHLLEDAGYTIEAIRL